MSTNPKKTSNPFLEVFARFWALWGLLWFAGTLLIVIFFYLPCFLLNDPAKARWHRQVSRVWMFVYLHIIGCPLRVTGKENFRKDTNYIVVCNHNSLMDVPVSTPFMPRANKTIAKKEFTKVPIFGWVYGFGSVLVDRHSDESRRKSYDEMKRMLSIGLDMVIYPEGTRNKSNDPLKPFYDGAFRLSEDTGKPILPVILFHTRTVLPANKFFYLLPHRLEMHFLPELSPTGKGKGELKQNVFDKMWAYIIAH